MSQSKGLKAHMEKRGKLKKERIDAGLPFLSPMIGPGYTPDAGVLFAIGGLLTFKTDRTDTLIQRSSLPVTFVATTRGNLSFGAKLKSFWWEDKVRMNVLAAFSDAKDDYFGVGYESAEEIPKGDSTTLYNRRSWAFNTEFLYQFKPNLFTGIILDFNMTNALENNPVMAQDPAFLEYGPENLNTGIGFTFQYDSRDIVVNAWKGVFADLAATFYTPGLGSDNRYQIVLLDLRHYRQLDRPGKTIAFRYNGRFGYGKVPWAEMTRLGGSRDLRGYIKGQYRDVAGMYFIAEYRHMFLDANQELSPHGFTAWVGSGTIFDAVENIGKWLPNFGFGYRFEVQPRMNLRIDFGFGRESTGCILILLKHFD
jgi:outer membrane protein assembly factor BamA